MQPQVWNKTRFHARLSANISAAALCVVHNWQMRSRISGAGEGSKHKVAEAVVIDTALQSQTFAVVAKRKINSVSLLSLQVWISNIKNQNARMRPVVIELLERGSAKRVLIIGQKRAAIPKGEAHSGAAGETQKVTLAKISFRTVAVLLNSSAELKTNAFKVDSL